MRRQRRGVIINIASVVGHVGTPMLSVYCATKFAVRGLSQSLRFELAGDGIKVVNFSPGYTDTEFFAHAIARKGAWRSGMSNPMSAAAVAGRLVDAAVRPRAEIVLTCEGRLIAFGARHFPRLLEWTAQKFFDRRAAAGLTRSDV
jgi:short-subunit dehydrogenase